MALPPEAAETSLSPLYSAACFDTSPAIARAPALTALTML
jgi:hypothetical protein